MIDSGELFGLVDCVTIPPKSSDRVAVDCIPPGPLDVVDFSVGAAVDCIPPGPLDVEDPSLGVAVVCIPPGPSVGEDPSLGVTDGGLLGRGLPSQGNLVDVEVDVEREVIIGGGT